MFKRDVALPCPFLCPAIQDHRAKKIHLFDCESSWNLRGHTMVHNRIIQEQSRQPGGISLERTFSRLLAISLISVSSFRLNCRNHLDRNHSNSSRAQISSKCANFKRRTDFVVIFFIRRPFRDQNLSRNLSSDFPHIFFTGNSFDRRGGEAIEFQSRRNIPLYAIRSTINARNRNSRYMLVQRYIVHATLLPSFFHTLHAP